MLLKHTVYIITGANRGFGKAIAETIASKVNQEKTSFILVGRDQSQLENVKFDETKSISCHYIANANFKGAKQAEESVIDKISNLIKVSYIALFCFCLVTQNQKAWQDDDIAPITDAVLINNAGSTGDLSKKVGDYNTNEIQDYVDLNVTSYISMV